MSKIKKGGMTKDKKIEIIFYVLMMAYPMLQFVIFWCGTNITALTLPFRNVDGRGNTLSWTFDNIKEAVQLITNSPLAKSSFKMTLIDYALGLVTTTPLSMLLSFYLAKKMPGTNAFRIILYFPCVVSAAVTSTIYIFFTERALPEIVYLVTGDRMKGIMESGTWPSFWAIQIFQMWSGLGGGVVIWSNVMSGASKDLIEAANLDGAVGIKEFWHVTFPHIYPTWSMLFVVGLAGIFMNQMSLYTFYMDRAPEDLQTFGYYFYVKTKNAGSMAEYPRLAAMGFLFTCVSIPILFGGRWVIEHYGPSED